MIIEGVRYHRFAVRFTLSNGKRRRWIRWSPGRPWIGEQFQREVHDREVPVKVGSNVYIRALEGE